MSYILDALRKSDADRAAFQRDSQLTLSPAAKHASPRFPWLIFALVACTATVLIGLNMYAYRHTEPLAIQAASSQLVHDKPATTGKPATNSKPIHVLTSPPVEPAELEPEPEAAIEHPAAQPSLFDAPLHDDPMQGDLIQSEPEDNLATDTSDAFDTDVPVETLQTSEPLHAVIEADKPSQSRLAMPVIEPVEETSAPAAADIPELNQLHPAIRQAIEPLQLEGHFHNESGRKSMVIIEGRIRHAGDWITNDLQLMQITEDGAVFNYREQPFKLSKLR